MSETGRPDTATVRAFEDRVHGTVLYPGDDAYAEARTVWNAMVDRYPSYVLRCTGAADVMAGVDFARDHDLTLSVKGGGHNFAGSAVCDDGLMLDLSEMDWVRVDPEAQTACVGPGATWADFDHEAGSFGLATTGGLVSTTGVAGLTLGGGQGYLARRHGLTIDNLVGADVVTAAGEVVHASAARHPDLFWALRGGGGNFGVVTAFEFDLHPVETVLAGPIFHPYENAREALQFYREYAADAPAELACYALVVRVPPEPPFPEAWQGEPSLVFATCYAGSIADGEAVLAPLREFGDSIVDAIQPMPYTALQQSFDDGSPEGHRWYSKAHYLDGLPDDAIDTVLEFTDPFPGPLTQVAIEPMGGAISEVDPDATAFRHRDAAYSLGIWPGWADPGNDDEMIRWARKFHESMANYADGVYANYLDRDEGDRVRTAYGENYERLVAIKNEWDPENLFQMNQNIEPTS